MAAARGLREACEGAHEARDACEDGRGDVEVVVFEADERVGRSILATGNGRCNFSNAQVEAGLYRNAAFVAAAFEALEARCGGRPLSRTQAKVHAKVRAAALPAGQS